jgi:sec-independent protein translocase protein TatA
VTAASRLGALSRAPNRSTRENNVKSAKPLEVTMFRNIGANEIIPILVVLMLLFGAKRLPDSARSLGRSMRIFRSEVKAMGNDGEDSAPPDASRVVEGRVVAPAPAERAATSPEHADRDRGREAVVDKVAARHPPGD